MVEDGFAETDQGPTGRLAQTVCLKKLAIATRNKTAAGPKQATQLAAVGMIRPDSAGDSGAEDHGAEEQGPPGVNVKAYQRRRFWVVPLYLITRM